MRGGAWGGALPSPFPPPANGRGRVSPLPASVVRGESIASRAGGAPDPELAAGPVRGKREEQG